MARCLLNIDHMKTNSIYQSFVILTLICTIVLLIVPQSVVAELQKSQRAGAELQISFLYLLSDFSGVVPSQWARVDYDQEYDEIFSLNPRTNEVRIFNREGMEIFAFGDQGEIVPLIDIAVGAEGRIYGLARNFREHGVQVFNYRGGLESTISLTGLPGNLADFYADRITFKNGKFYLLDSRALKFVVTSTDGSFLQLHDVAARLWDLANKQDPEKKKLSTLDVSGFSVGPQGELYFTVPLLFSAFRLNTAGTLDIFGTSGSGPGKFGVVSGIAGDEQGMIYIADRLRSVVMLFDKKFRFLGEFGYRGGRAEDMIVPDDLAVDFQGGRVFVSQAANKGVGVYRVFLSKRADPIQ